VPAAEALFFPLLYDELRGIARRQLGAERPGHTLSATALVHEAYFRMVDQTRFQWINRARFLSVAARAMRRILVDHARLFRAARRGGPREQVALDDVEIPIEERADRVIALDDAPYRGRCRVLVDRR
jgi:RNA polymerase sigma-70 factor, ECF subfamily